MSFDTKEDLLQARFNVNMQRIERLIALAFGGAERPPPTGVVFESEDVRADLLRTIVVFLHATFEDVLRTAARQRLGDADPTVLETIPLVGTTKLGRPEKFHLGALATHRGKTIDHLIQESVDGYLNRKSFGSCADVNEILRQMGLNTEPFKCLYADIDRMMEKRHLIVHRADLPSTLDPSSPPWMLRDQIQLFLWKVAVLAFYALLRVSLDPADELNQWYFERRMKAIELIRKSIKDMLPDQNADSGSKMVPVDELIQQVFALPQALAQLGPPSQAEMLALAERIKAKKAE